MTLSANYLFDVENGRAYLSRADAQVLASECARHREARRRLRALQKDAGDAVREGCSEAMLSVCKRLLDEVAP